MKFITNKTTKTFGMYMNVKLANTYNLYYIQLASVHHTSYTNSAAFFIVFIEAIIVKLTT